MAEDHFAASDLFYIVLNVFRIGSNDRAVVMIGGAFRFVAFIEQAGIEDEIHLLLDEPLNMSMGQLGRIAFRLAGDGLDAKFVDLAVR